MLGSGHSYSSLEFAAAAALGVGLAMGIIGDGAAPATLSAAAASGGRLGPLAPSAVAGGALALSAILCDVFVSTYEQVGPRVSERPSPRPPP